MLSKIIFFGWNDDDDDDDNNNNFDNDGGKWALQHMKSFFYSARSIILWKDYIYNLDGIFG